MTDNSDDDDDDEAADDVLSNISENSSRTIEGNDTCDIHRNDNIPSLHDLAARYLFKIKEGNRLTNKATQSIVAATSQLFNKAFEQLERDIAHSLTDVGMDLEDVPGISDAFDNVINPFGGLKSTWRQQEYLKNDPTFVVCKK